MATVKRSIKLPKVTQYVKNVGRSLSYASVEAIKANTTGISEFVDSNQDIVKELYSGVRNYRQTIRATSKKITQSKIYEAVNAGVKNMIEDAKTGNFYNTAREQALAGDVIGIDFDDDDDFDSFSFDDSGKSESHPSSSDSFEHAIGAAATAQTNAVAASTDLMIKSNTASTKLIVSQIDRFGSSISAGIGSLYVSVDSINKFLNGPMLTHLENSKTFFESTSSMLQEQNAMIKEMLEMQRNLYKAQEASYKNSRLDESMNSDGSADIRGYLKNIKKNLSDAMDSSGLSMLDMDIGGGNPYLAMTAAPFKIVLDSVMQRMMSKEFKSALKSFDKGMTTLFSQFVAKMNRSRNSQDGSLMATLGKIFGINIDVKDKIDTSKYNKGAIQFDGIARQAIIEVIPGYLARIEAALTGSEERHYDMENGKWKNISRVRKEFEDDKKNAIANANWSVRRDLEEFLKAVEARDKKQAEELEKSMNKMFTKIFEDSGDFNPDMGKGKNDIEEAWRYYGFKSKEAFESAIKNISRDTMRDIAYSNLRARQDLSRTRRRQEENGGPQRQLFNGAYDDSNLDKNRTGNVKFGGGIGLLASSRDENGNNIFWYLKEILNKIGTRSTSNNKNNTKKGKKNRSKHSQNSRTTESSSEESSSDSSDGDPAADEDSSANFDWEEIEKERKKKAEEKAKEKAFGNWIKEKLDKSAVGRKLNQMGGFAQKLFTKPMEYMTKMLNKADEGLFKMMFGKNEFKDDEGNPIDSVFQYIMYHIKKSFNNLTNELKNSANKFFKDHIKPVWDRYGKPVTDEVKKQAKAGWERVKRGVSNTFGRGYSAAKGKYEEKKSKTSDNVEDTLNNGGVVDSEDVKNSESSAFGRIVTKRGLTMISPGEVIIPSTFDKKKQRKQLELEKKEKKRIIDAIGFNAAGTVDTEDFKKKLYDIYEENKGNKASIAASGILGAGVGLITPFGPLLGAVAGAGINILKHSETFQDIVFGKAITDEAGNKVGREGGIVSKKIYDTFKKYGSDAIDFGIAGGIAGLFTPFGPLGGAVIGAGVGILKNSDTFKKFIFGDEATGEDGLISKEAYDKFKSMVKKSAPRMAIGAGAGILAGPFGILGNAVMGAGLGLLSSTDSFHKFIFGDKDDPEANSLMKAINTGIIEPAKERITAILLDLKEFAKKNVFKPLKTLFDPLKDAIKNMTTSVMDGIKDKLNDMFEKTIGIPIHDFLQQKIFKPMTKIFFTLLKAPITLAKAPIKLAGNAATYLGTRMRMSQIDRGTAYSMSANERLAYRDEFSENHKIRSAWRNLRGKDKTREQDELLASMGEDQLSEISRLANAGLESKETLSKNVGNARAAVGGEISKFFNKSKGSGGRNLYDVFGYNHVKKLAEVAAEGDMDAVNKYIDKYGSKLTKEEKAELISRIKDKMDAAASAQANLDAANLNQTEVDKRISELLGRKFSGRKDMRKIKRATEAELKARKRSEIKEEESPEEEATNNLSAVVDNKTTEIINILTDTRNFLFKLITGKDYEDIDKKTSDDTSENEADGEKKDQSPVTKAVNEMASPIEGDESSPEEEAITSLSDIVSGKTSAIANQLDTTNKYLHRIAYPDEEDPNKTKTPAEKNKPVSEKIDEQIDKGAVSATTDSPIAKAISNVTTASNNDANVQYNPLTNKMVYLDKKTGEPLDDKNTKETVDILEKKDKQDEELLEETKAGNGIWNYFTEKLFGSNRKKKKNKDKNGIFGAIGSKVGTIMKYIGIGVAGIAGISLFGHATEWFKTSIWPHLKTALFGTTNEDGSKTEGIIGGIGRKFKELMFGTTKDDGTKTYGLLGGLKNLLFGNEKTGQEGLLPKLFNWAEEKYTKVKEFIDSKGGLGTIIGSALKDHLIPGLTSGLGLAMNNVITPLVSGIITNLPSLIVAVGKGIIEGLKGLFNKDLPNQEDNIIAAIQDEANTGADNSISGITTNSNDVKDKFMAVAKDHLPESVLNIFSGSTSTTPATSGQAAPTTGSSNANAQTNDSASVNGQNIPTADSVDVKDLVSEQQTAAASGIPTVTDTVENPEYDTIDEKLGRGKKNNRKSPGIMGLLGQTQRTNDVTFTKDGSKQLTTVKQFNTTDSLASRTLKSMGRNFLNGLAGQSTSSWLLNRLASKNLLKGLGARKFIMGKLSPVFATTKLGSRLATKGSAMAVKGSGNLGTKLHDKWAKRLGNNVDDVADNIIKFPTNAANDVAEGVMKLPGAADDIVDNIIKFPGSAANDVAEVASSGKIASLFGKAKDAIYNTKVGKAFGNAKDAITNNKVVQTLGKAKNFVSDKFHNSILSKTHRKEIYSNIAEKGKELLGKGIDKGKELLGEGIQKGKDLLSQGSQKIKDKLLGSAVEEVGEEAVSNVTESAIKNVAEEGLESAAKTATKELAESGAKAAGNAASGLGEKIAGGIKKVFGWLTDSKVGSWIMKAFTKNVGPNVVSAALEKVADKLSKSIVTKLAGKALNSIAKGIAGLTPVGIILIVKDFIYGYNNADTFLGVAKGDTYKVGVGQKVICGLLNVINEKITFGLLPVSSIIDVFVDLLFPLMGINVEELQAARDRANDIVEEWNKAHPDEQYDNLEDYNDKDKLTTKVKKAAGKAWDWTKDKASKAWEGIKSVGKGIGSAASKAWNWLTGKSDKKEEEQEPEEVEVQESEAEDGGGGANSVLQIASKHYGKATKAKNEEDGGSGFSIVNSFKNFTSNIFGGIKDFVDSASDSSSLISSVKDRILGFFKTGKLKKEASSEKISKDDPLASIKQVVKSTTDITTLPITLITSAFSGIKDSMKSMFDKSKNLDSKSKTEDDKVDKLISDKSTSSTSKNVFSTSFWKTENYDNNGIMGNIYDIKSKLTKILTAPIAIVKDISKRISTAFSGNTSWFSKVYTDAQNTVNTVINNANSGYGRTKKYGKGRAASSNEYYGYGHQFQSGTGISRMRYGNSTIGEAGCAPVAATNLINNMDGGRTMDVERAKEFAERSGMVGPDGGTNMNYFNSFLASQGIPTRTTADKGFILDSIKNGNQVIMLGQDGNDNPGAPFGTTPHYITAVGQDRRGNIIVEDPDLPQSRVAYSKNKLMGSVINSVVAANPKARAMRRQPRKNIIKNSKQKRIKYGKSRNASLMVTDSGGNPTTTPSSITNLGPNAIINVARSQIGVTEVPYNEVKYNYAYYGKNVNGDDEYPWCAVFVWWVFNQAGAAKLFMNGEKSAYCPTIKRWYEQKGQAVQTPQPGDIVYFNFGGGTGAQHIGIVSQVIDGTSFMSIEGNTRNDDPTNGGAVLEQRRTISQTVGFSRPKYPYTYDASSVIDMRKYGDSTNYKSIALNGGYMDASMYSGEGFDDGTGSTTGTLLEQFKDLGTTMVKKLFGEDAYNAFFGSSNTQNIEGTQFMPTSSSDLQGSTNAAKVWDYLTRGKGYTKEGAAGLMGNLDAESGIIPNNLQNTYNDKFGVSDDEYTNSVNNRTRSKSSFSNDSAGYGLAQWTYNSRKEGLYDYTINQGKSIADLAGQLDWLSKELATSYSSVGDLLRTTTSVNAASDKVLEDFENPQNKNYDDRRQRSQKYYEMFKNYVYSPVSTPAANQNINITDTGGGFDIGYSNGGSKKDAFEQKYGTPKSDNNDRRSSGGGSSSGGGGGGGNRKMVAYGRTKKNNFVGYGRTNRYNQNTGINALNNLSKGSVYGGTSADILNSHTEYADGTSYTNSVAAPSTIPSQAVDYQTFLQTIVSILMSISDNTSLLTKILQVLSDNFDIKIDKGDIDAAASKTRAQTEKALNELVQRSSGNNTNISKLLNNKDTAYLLEAMSAIAKE